LNKMNENTDTAASPHIKSAVQVSTKLEVFLCTDKAVKLKGKIEEMIML